MLGKALSPSPGAGLGRLCRGARAICTFLLIAGCGAPTAAPPTRDGSAPESPPVFVERAAESGLDFTHFNGMSGERYMVEVLGAGAALFDYDNDDDLDIYLRQGEMLGPAGSVDEALFPPRHPLPLTDRLYRNDFQIGPDAAPSLRFTDVTEQAGLSGSAYGMGVAAGDYDNDGWIDLYLTNFGPNRLLHNNGDGTFSDVTAASGTGDDGWSVPASFFDFDRDGRLDLFVGNYVEFDYARLPVCKDLTGARDYCGPGVFDEQADRLFRNLGNGTFEDVSEAVGLGSGFGPALGAVTTDFNGDGWLDVYVANDGKANNLWINDRGTGFSDQALLAGCAVSASGKAEGSMGVDAGDFDGDGDPDLFMTHLTKETNTLYLNNGRGLFEDRTTMSGLGAASLAATGFGTAWIDYDNDGRLDLLTANGAVTRIPALVEQGDPYPLHQPNQLFRNLGEGRFDDAGEAASEAFALSEVSRGAVFGDLDNDGDVDVLVTNNNGPARLLVNEYAGGNHWLGLRLVTGEPARDALGASAQLFVAGAPPLWRRVRVEAGYASANDPRLRFGLGPSGAVERLVVRWPEGELEEWTGLEIDRYHKLRRGEGRPVEP